MLDLGSHTFHALVAEVDAIGIRHAVMSRKLAVRVGEHALASGAIGDEERAHAHLALADLVARTGRRVRAVATGAFREAANGPDVIEELAARHGIEIELLDQREEAQLTWLGVSAELAGAHRQLAVLGLGGSSLACTAGERTCELALTLPLGTLRLRERGAQDVRSLAATVAAPALAELRDARPHTIALASGTARALLRLAGRLGLVRDGQRYVARRTFSELACTLAPLAPKAIAALGVAPARCDTIANGAAMVDAVLAPLDVHVVYVARSALREGALIDQARRAVAHAA